MTSVMPRRRLAPIIEIGRLRVAQLPYVAQGCDEYQGYFFSKPVPEAQARALLPAAALGEPQIRFTAH